MEAAAGLDVHLVRHAPAGHADASRWPDDRERPLTPEGVRRFRAAARGLRRLVPEVGAVLSSGWTRAWQTAELLREEAGWPEPRRCAALERAPGEALLAVLRECGERSIALVGHEPWLSGLASLLCTGDEYALSLELRKGAVTLLSFDGAVQPGGARLRWALAPRILRALDDGPG